MKRDLDLVRQILFEIERHEHGWAPQALAVEGYDQEQTGYHIYLMGQAGLLNVADSTHLGSTSPQAIAMSITWAGHDFLDAAREPSLWEKAKQKVGGSFASMSFDLVKELLVALARAQLNLGC